MDTHVYVDAFPNDTVHSPIPHDLSNSPMPQASYFYKDKLFYGKTTITDASSMDTLSPCLLRSPQSFSFELDSLESVDDFQSNMSADRTSRFPLSMRPGLAGLGIQLDGLLSALSSTTAQQLFEHEDLGSQEDTVMADLSYVQRSTPNSPDLDVYGIPKLQLQPSYRPVHDAFSSGFTSFTMARHHLDDIEEESMSVQYEDALMIPCGPDAVRNEPLVGLFPDINMHALAMNEEPIVCVNPADIMGQESLEIVKEEPDQFEVDFVAHSLLESFPSAEDTPPSQSDSQSFGTSLSTQSGEDVHDLLAQSFVKLEAIAEEAAAATMQCPKPPLISLNPNFLQYPAPAATFYVKEETNAIPLDPSVPCFFPSAEHVAHYRAPIIDIKSNQFHSTHARTTYTDSPVLNAHLGVDAEVLRDKVERYKLRHPGQEMDSSWFFPFVGKLSQHGELLEDYRCYVKGCTQTNKRRDHIVTHVGSHVDHRPYECSHCGHRFLRKNECRRHESRHAQDFKSFICTMCPPDESKSYSRQDTLKRHMNKAHGMPLGSSRGKRTGTSKRRRVRDEDVFMDDESMVRDVARECVWR